MDVENIMARYTLQLDDKANIVGVGVVSDRPKFMADQFSIRPLSRWERFKALFRKARK